MIFAHNNITVNGTPNTKTAYVAVRAATGKSTWEDETISLRADRDAYIQEGTNENQNFGTGILTIRKLTTGENGLRFI